MGCGSSQTVNHNPSLPPESAQQPQINVQLQEAPVHNVVPLSYAETGPQTTHTQDQASRNGEEKGENTAQNYTGTQRTEEDSDVASVDSKNEKFQNIQPADIVSDQSRGDEKQLPVAVNQTDIQDKEKEMTSQVESRFPELRSLVSNLRNNVQTLEKIRNENGMQDKLYWQTLQALNRQLTSASQLNTTEKKKAIGLFTAEIGFVKMMADDLKMIQSMHRDDSSYINVNWKSIYYNLLVNINYTDTLPTYSKALVDNGVLDVYKYFMETLNLSQGANETYVVKVSAETMVNLSRAVSVHVLRQSGVVTQLIPLVTSADQSIAIASLIALAAIADEEQNNLLMANPEPIRMIIKLLKKALDCPNHRLVQGTQWAAYELADGLSQLASNDNNKIQIVHQGGLPVINDFLQKAANANEQESAARCLWMLAFNKDNVAKIKLLPGCLDLLRTLKKSSDNDVARAASGALWEIEQKEQRNERVRQSQSNLRGVNDEDDKLHIMISYQWEVQNTLVKVKNHLQQLGYRVWMDIEQMQGSTLEEMAKAVENAAVVLICVSSKYKDSPNCRTEAEYAFQLKKDVVPLMMEPNFKPDGWLGMICGAKFWYDFREKMKRKESIDKLGKDLKERAQKAHTGFKGAVRETTAAVVAESAETGSGIFKWTGKDVVEWVNGIGLKSISTDCFSQFNGDLLVELYKLRQESPDFYYQSLQKELGITRLLDVLKFNKALASIV